MEMNEFLTPPVIWFLVGLVLLLLELAIPGLIIIFFGKNNTMIIPSNMADISSIIATVTSVFDNTKKKH